MSVLCLWFQRSLLAEMDVRRMTFLVLHKCEFPKYFTYRTRSQVGVNCLWILLNVWAQRVR